MPQFDLAAKVAADGSSVGLEPLDEQAMLTRSYPGQGQARALAERWRRLVPDAKIEPQGDRVVVSGTAEEHELLDAARKQQPAASGAGKKLALGKPLGDGSPRGKTIVKTPAKKVYSLKIDKVPIGALIAELGKKLELEVVLDDASIKRQAVDMDQLVSFEVKNVSLDELLSAALAPAELTFRRDDRRLSITPREKR